MPSLRNKRVLVTGGAGFVGSHLVDRLIGESPERVVVVDNFFLGTENNLAEARRAFPKLAIHRLDASDLPSMQQVVDSEGIEVVFNLAVIPLPTSLEYPSWTISTNISIATVFCELARQKKISTLAHCSSSEAYGSALYSSMDESHPLVPTTPYAASKAGGEMMLRAYHVTYGLHTTVTRGSNTFGPYQYPEKIAPFFITEAIEDHPLPLYGDGMQVRDWLYVDDHCDAVDVVLHRGAPGEIYNVGGEHELHNIEVTRFILKALGKPDSLIRYVQDRPGHDRRYALTNDKILAELGWEPQYTFEEAMAATVRWYQANDWWWRKIKTGEYLDYYKRQYAERLAGAKTL